MEAKKNVFLEERSVAALMRQYALPCVISLLVGALYNIVDQIYIANADYLGAWGNAANTVVFPLTVVGLALAVMVGDGCCAYVSLHLGKGQQQTAARSVGGSILLTLGMSAALTAVYLLFGDSLLALFGGKVSEKTFSLSREYFFYITLGIPFYMFGQAMNPIIRADGSPRFAMISTLAGALLNIVLDPVFIYTFRWGMMGAAVATVLGQILTAALAVWYLCRMKTIRLTKDAFRPDWAVAGRSLSLGLCSFLAQISLVAAMAATNNMLRQYGAQDAVFGQTLYAHIPLAVVGIVMKVFQIVMSVSIGMAAGCIPLVGYNIGAGRKDRVKQLFIRLLATEALLGMCAMLVAELLPRQLLGIFGAANESVHYTEFGIRAFRIYLSMSILACVNKAAFIFLQAMGKAAASTGLSMVREILFGVGLCLLLPPFLGLDGVLYSMPLSDILTFCVTLWLVGRTLKQLKEQPV